jgi:hypothetical protein
VNYLIGDIYVPVRQAVAGSGDWTMIAALVAVMAIAFGATFVMARGSVSPKPMHRREPAEVHRKVA